MQPDDRQLLLAMRRGHEASARLLWERHAPRLLAHARAILPGPGAAEDVVQAVMCRLLALPRARLAVVEDVPAFLAATTRREALNHLRADRRERARRIAAPARGWGPGSAPVPDLHGALAALPRRWREVVVLKHLCGLTFGQMALALCANRNTVAGRYRAALARLRDLLGDAPVPEGATYA
jgi:RNA polymerase sigma-70 factor (ECF subfamily)